MDFPLHRNTSTSRPFPWRAAAVIVAAVAALELVLLVVVGGALLAKPDAKRPAAAKAAASRTPAKVSTAKAVKTSKAPAAATRRAPAAAVAELPRRKVEVLVLNGNGRTGAAGAAASRVGRKGYKVGAVGNAPRQDYPQSIVLFRRGFEGEGQRLARDLGVKVIGPLDGMRTGQLHGAHVVLILGS